MGNSGATYENFRAPSGTYPLSASDVHGNVRGPGTGVLAALTTGQFNTGMGDAALSALTTPNANTAFGSAALSANTTGSMNTAVGRESLLANTTGIQNTAVGHASLIANTTGSGNIAIGYSAFDSNTTGSNGVAIGYNALRSATTANANTGVGYNVCYSPAGVTANGTVVGTGITCVGYRTGAGTANDPSYFTCLGHQTLCDASGGMAIGADHTGASAHSTAQDLIVLGTALHTTRIPGIPAFVAGDQYLVVDASGNIHKSALGPAS